MLWLRRFFQYSVLFVLNTSVFAQEAGKIRGADERFKADILLVVAHPDDEGAVTPYLARAIYDLHKRVAVVYGTHGSSGGNSYGSERATALGDIREMEARAACARLGIQNVWFLAGNDTASQNVLNSLANWGHGANLEKMVELIRLTRPEIVITSLPGVFIGENHGDHQAAGVLATEAFDSAANATIFPEQVAGASPNRELYLENLKPWKASKIYYFADAQDDKQFAGSGPAYSIKEISPSQNKPYWRLAIDAATTHLTQYPEEIHALEKLGDAELEKRMSDPHTGWWSDPETLIFGKSNVGGVPTDDVFARSMPGPASVPGGVVGATEQTLGAKLTIGGPWEYYERFRAAHGLLSLPVSRVPEIAIKAGMSVYVPLTIRHAASEAMKVTIRAEAPAGWKVTSGQGDFVLPAESSTEMRVELDTPHHSEQEVKRAEPQLITVRAEADGKSIGEVNLRVLLRQSALPQ